VLIRQKNSFENTNEGIKNAEFFIFLLTGTLPLYFIISVLYSI
jgi:hypothetical protein